MKQHSEMNEGPGAWTRADAFIGKLMAVPHSVIVEREADHKRRAALNPPSVSPAPDVQPTLRKLPFLPPSRSTPYKWSRRPMICGQS
jgi:hypothetical protein